MGVENKARVVQGRRYYRTFRREREAPKPIPEGAWESILVAVKPDLSLEPSETMGMGDSDFWIYIEENATMSPKKAAMQFYLHNVGHRTLTSFVTFAFLGVRSAMKTGDIDREQKRLLEDRIAARLLDLYPPAYRVKFGK